MTEETKERLATFGDSSAYPAVAELLDRIVQEYGKRVLSLGDTPENQAQLAVTKSQYTGAAKLRDEFVSNIKPRKKRAASLSAKKKS